jgi:hypothetical protein
MTVQPSCDISVVGCRGRDRDREKEERPRLNCIGLTEKARGPFTSLKLLSSPGL